MAQRLILLDTSDGKRKTAIAFGNGQVARGNSSGNVVLSVPPDSVAETISSAASVTISLTNSRGFLLTLNQNTTISAISNAPTWASLIVFFLKVTQDATGARTLTYPGNVSVTGTINSAASSSSIIKFITFDGGTSWDAIVQKPLQSSTSSLWKPSQITTALWLDATDTATISIGTGISQWNDKSGNSRHATQSTGASQPSFITNAINGLSIVRFDGSNDCLTFDGSFLVNTNYTIAVAVARSSTKSSNLFLGGSGASSNGNFHAGWRDNTTFTHAQYTNDYNMTVSGYSSISYEVFVIIHSTTTGKKVYRNGTLLGSSSDTASLSSWAGAAVGRYSSDYFQGDIAELIISTANPDYQILEGYLAHKLSLAINLPSNHPYKNSAPNI